MEFHFFTIIYFVNLQNQKLFESELVNSWLKMEDLYFFCQNIIDYMGVWQVLMMNIQGYWVCIKYCFSVVLEKKKIVVRDWPRLASIHYGNNYFTFIASWPEPMSTREWGSTDRPLHDMSYNLFVTFYRITVVYRKNLWLPPPPLFITGDIVFLDADLLLCDNTASLYLNFISKLDKMDNAKLCQMALKLSNNLH